MVNLFQAEAWQSIQNEYNAQATVKRTLQQLQGKFENLKSEVRKAAAAHKLQYSGTGGGPHMEVKFDPVFQAALELLHEKTVIGIQSKFDCDAYDDTPSGYSEDLPLVGFFN